MLKNDSDEDTDDETDYDTVENKKEPPLISANSSNGDPAAQPYRIVFSFHVILLSNAPYPLESRVRTTIIKPSLVSYTQTTISKLRVS